MKDHPPSAIESTSVAGKFAGMQTLPQGRLTELVTTFLNLDQNGDGRAREFSFDFAYNFFAEHDHPTQAMQESCMQLGYYLASWGMLRGSSYLFNKTNATAYKPVIEVIERRNPELRQIDADSWADADARRTLLDTYAEIRTALLKDSRATHLTLVTKIMLGVWGCVPAFDSYASTALKSLTDQRKGDRFTQFSDRSLVLLSEFYEGHRGEVDDLAARIHTRGFMDEKETPRKVPRAKIIDMALFQYAASGHHRRPHETA